MNARSYQYIFGPVPSRRLGFSLGIDLFSQKTCTMNCIYCECGATTLTATKRDEYVPTQAVIRELDAFCKEYTGRIDYLTFSGQGEPTLHSGLGAIITHIKSHYSYPIAVITNSTLLDNPDVQRALSAVDVVMPSLDSAIPETLQKINHPAEPFNAHQIINGLKDFSAHYKGTLWLEILFVKGMNDSEEELQALKEIIDVINPTAVQLNSIDRPAWKQGIEPVGDAFLAHARSVLGPKASPIPPFNLKAYANTPLTEQLEKIENLIQRRPETLEHIAAAFNMTTLEAHKYIHRLLEAKRIVADDKADTTYYRVVKGQHE